MPTPIIKQCPQCGTTFQARRKNQDYCTNECRTDYNNGLAKERYATFKEEAPKVNSVNQELKELKQYIASLTIVIEGVKAIDFETITYQGKKYKREYSLDHLKNGIMLQSGGAILMPGNKIIYRHTYDDPGRGYGSYIPQK